MTKSITLPHSLRDILSNKELCWLAGEKTFATGKEYFEQEKVSLIKADCSRLDATVYDNQQHCDCSIYLRQDGDFSYRCNCAAGRRELFCSHCVAAVLFWLSKNYDGDNHWTIPLAKPMTAESGLPALRKHLESIDKISMIEFLLDLAEDDSTYMQRLLSIPAIKLAPKNIYTESKLFEEIDDAFEEYIGVPVDYDEIQLALDDLEQALIGVLIDADFHHDSKLTAKLVQRCLDLCHQSIDVVRDFNQERKMIAIIKMLEGWNS